MSWLLLASFVEECDDDSRTNGCGQQDPQCGAGGMQRAGRVPAADRAGSRDAGSTLYKQAHASALTTLQKMFRRVAGKSIFRLLEI